MARSKAVLAVGRTKKAKEVTASSNKFQALEVEKPYDWFPFLKLPAEIRDEIYDYIAGMVVQYQIRYRPAENSFFVKTVDIRNGRSTSTMSLGPKQDLPRRSRPRPRSALAMKLVNKQVSGEFEGAVSRMMPHHIRGELLRYSRGSNVVLRDNLLELLPTSVRRLYIRNQHGGRKWCLPDSAQARVAMEAPLTRLFQQLRECTGMTELVVDWCTIRDRVHDQPPVETNELHDTLVEAARSLPMLKVYCIRDCRNTTFAIRRNGKDWVDVKVGRVDAMGHALPDREWKQFMRNMPVSPGWRCDTNALDIVGEYRYGAGRS